MAKHQRWIRRFVNDERKIDALKRLSARLGYDWTMWDRSVAYQTCEARLREIGLDKLDVLEISAGDFWKGLPFRSYREANYPDFDLCSDVLDQQFDLIICDQVFEHLLWPYKAARNVHQMLRPGGYFMNLTPFITRIHDGPHDCTRWTAEGMQHFLAECGFDFERIETGAWGNRACAKANFNKWSHRGFLPSIFAPQHNEADMPVSVWAFAQK